MNITYVRYVIYLIHNVWYIVTTTSMEEEQGKKEERERNKRIVEREEKKLNIVDINSLRTW